MVNGISVAAISTTMMTGMLVKVGDEVASPEGPGEEVSPDGAIVTTSEGGKVG
jgi:hypothetical protein